MPTVRRIGNIKLPEYRENSRFDYDEGLAIAESFARAMRQLREGKTYSTEEVLAQLVSRGYRLARLTRLTRDVARGGAWHHRILARLCGAGSK